MKKIINILFGFLIVSQLGLAKKFENNYISFDLPVGWECSLEGTEYICQSTIEERKKEAIVIFAAKMRGKTDTLRHYQAYLKKRKKMKLESGEILVSEPKAIKVSKINNHSWINALHLSSEIPDYYTRYLATVKDDLGIAFTMSIARPFYSTYRGHFSKMINSIRVFRKRGGKVGKSSKFKDSKKRTLLDEIEMVSQEDFSPINLDKKAKEVKKKDGSSDLMFYILILVGLLAFIFLRKR